MVTRTWPVLQSFEKDQTRQNFVINQISGGVTDLAATVAAGGAVFGPSGPSHSIGTVPDPGATAGIGRFLREDATWQVQREGLTANRTYFVGGTGANDANDGLSATVTGGHGPVATLQRALFYAYGLIDLQGFNVTIQLATGTYTGPFIVNAPQVGAGVITINGDATTPGNTILTSATATVQVSRNALLTLSNLRIQATGGSGYCIISQLSGIVQAAGKLEFGAAAQAHMYATGFGTIDVGACNYTILGDAAVHMLAQVQGFISNLASLSGGTVTISTARAFTTFAYSANLSQINASATYTGAGVATTTGQKFSVTINGVIYVNGGGTSYLPGTPIATLPPTQATGGQYL